MIVVPAQTARGVGLAVLIVCTLGAADPRPGAAADAALGKRIYRDGVLPSGRPLRGRTRTGLKIEGGQFSCANCHRPSGFGSSEGAVYVPPVTAPALFRANQPRRAELFRRLYQEDQPDRLRARVRFPRLRPAYTDQSLALALRDGRDPTGRTLDNAMPRYQLSDPEIGHLVAYLRSLAATADPGVDASTIHFATVTTPGVAEGERQAMLDVMVAYVRRKNADTRRELARPGHSPWYKDDFYGSYRTWALHVWQLEGPLATWSVQLEARYLAQPVFALLSGIGAGAWRPVHAFCERRMVPCLFPHTELPVVSPVGSYALYLSKGLIGEAQVLARHLLQTSRRSETTTVLQLYGDYPYARGPARALRHALQGKRGIALSEHPIADRARLTAAFWRATLADARPAVLVLWLADLDLTALGAAIAEPGGPRQIYLSHRLSRSAWSSAPPHLREKIRLTYRYALPQASNPRLYRVRAWLRSRGIRRRHDHLQLNTFFALTVADHALVHLVDSFSRDYFIERIEHETENALNPGVFPTMSLGPGQRFASKGGYIVRLADGAQGDLAAVSPWIVP